MNDKVGDKGVSDEAETTECDLIRRGGEQCVRKF